MSKPILALFGVALAVVAFALGHYTASPAATEPKAHAARSTEGATPAIESVDEAREALLDVLHDSDPYQRLSRLAALLPRLGPEAAVPAVRSVLEEPFLDISSTEALLLLRAWSEYDPEAAFRWVRQEGKIGWGEAALDLTLEKWAAENPRAALVATRGLGRAPFSKALQIALIRGWLVSDDPALEEYVRSLGMGFERQRAIQELVHQRLLRDGPEETMRWAEAIPEYEDHRYKLNVFRRLGGDLATLDPKLGVAWCEKHCDGPYGNNVRSWVIQGWARSDGQGAMEWASKTPPGPDQELVVRDAFRYWRGHDAEGLKSWFAAKKPEELEAWLLPVAGNYAHWVAEDDPLAAIAWTQRLPDAETKEAILIQLARRWYRKDATAAEAWLVDSPLSEEQRKSVREQPMKVNARAHRPKNAAPPAPPSPPSEDLSEGDGPS